MSINFRIWLPALMAAWVTMVCGSCGTHHQAMSTMRVKEKTLVGEYDKGWLRYKVYLLPAERKKRVGLFKPAAPPPVVFSIMIINMQDNYSPLRKLCTSLEEYNIYYEYLLNQTKNDLVLLAGNEVQYPVYYSFENNYNAFPFETINVGYDMSQWKFKRKEAKDTRLLYMDKVFSHDTLLCNLSIKTL